MSQVRIQDISSTPSPAEASGISRSSHAFADADAILRFNAAMERYGTADAPLFMSEGGNSPSPFEDVLGNDESRIPLGANNASIMHDNASKLDMPTHDGRLPLGRSDEANTPFSADSAIAAKTAKTVWMTSGANNASIMHDNASKLDMPAHDGRLHIGRSDEANTPFSADSAIAAKTDKTAWMTSGANNASIMHDNASKLDMPTHDGGLHIGRSDEANTPFSADSVIAAKTDKTAWMTSGANNASVMHDNASKLDMPAHDGRLHIEQRDEPNIPFDADPAAILRDTSSMFSMPASFGILFAEAADAVASSAPLGEIDLEMLVERILVSTPESGGREVRLILGGELLAGTEIVIQRDLQGLLSIQLNPADNIALQTLVASQYDLKQILEARENNSVHIAIGDSPETGNDPQHRSKGHHAHDGSKD